MVPWQLTWGPCSSDGPYDEPASYSCLKYAKLVCVGHIKSSLWGCNTSLCTGLHSTSLFPNSSSLLYMIYAMFGLMLVISFMMKDCFIQEPYVISGFFYCMTSILQCLWFFLDIFCLNGGWKCLNWFTKWHLIIFHAQVIIPKTWYRVTPKYFSTAMLVGCSDSKLRWAYSTVALWFCCRVFLFVGSLF